MAASSDIETLVRVVIERLRAMGAALPTAEIAGKPELSLQTPPDDTESHTLRLGSRLITLDDVHGRMAGVKTVQVDARAVVTPAVHDELRGLGIELRRLSGLDIQQRAVDSPSLLVVVPSALESRLARSLRAMGVSLVVSDSETALQEIDRHLALNNLACIWCSPRPYAAIRSVAGSPKVVAVQLAKLQDLLPALEQAQPNLLILDLQTWLPAAIVNLARRWLRKLPIGGVPSRSILR